MKPQSLWRDWPWVVTLVVVATFVFGVAAFLDPEPYHDGSQLPAAIALSEGMVIHRDVFSGYGFLTAWLHAAAVELFGPYLLTIRIFTSVLLVLAAVLLFFLIRVTTKKPLFAFLAASVWVVAWPGQAVVWGTPLLPWPSVVFLVFQLGAVLLTLEAINNSDRRTFLLAMAGVLVGLGILSRINYGVALALALFVALLLVKGAHGLCSRDLIVPILTASGTITLSMAILVWQGALAPFVQQSIVGPLQGRAIIKATEWFYIENGYLWGSVLVLGVSLTVWFLAMQTSIGRRMLYGIAVLGVSGLSLWASAAIESSSVRSFILSRLTWAPTLDIQAMQPMYFSVIITLFVGAATVVLALRFVLTRGNGAPSNDRTLLVFLALTSVASLFQLFPIADPNHLWWAAPLPMALLIFAFTQSVAPDRQLPVVIVLLAPPLVLAPFTFSHLVSQPRITIDSGSLSGMHIKTQYADSVRTVDRMLADVQPRSAEFVCQEGLFAVWNGKYLASGPGYVRYAYGLEPVGESRSTDRRFICLDDAPSDPRGSIEIEEDRFVTDFGRVWLSDYADSRIVEVRPRLE